jgi:hypothetical protein
MRLMLLLSLTIITGCSSASTPTTTATITPAVDTPIITAPTVAKPEPVTLPEGHELDVAKHVPPKSSLSGRLDGLGFTPLVTIMGQDLTISSTGQTATIQLSVKLPGDLAKGTKLVVKVDQATGTDVPRLDTQSLQTNGAAKLNSYANGYAFSLQLSPRDGTRQTGWLWLSLPDEAKSYVVGTFSATVLRTFDETPTGADKPWLGGVVKLPANPTGELEAGIMGFVNNNLITENVSLPLGPKEARSARTESTHPTSVVMTTTGQYRYEHIRLEPGRYLVWVRLKPGPASWKFVTITADSASDYPVSLDAQATGKVKVTAPDGTGTIKLIPVDTGDMPANIPELALAFALKLEATVAESDKAFAQVPVGQYLALRVAPDGSIRARNPVSVKPGETVTVELK